MATSSSKGYDPNIQAKANSPLAQSLQRMASDTKALADYLGCTVQAINQYKQGTSFPKTENLIKIADFLGVSVDYLLGQTGVPNRDTSIQSVHDNTGLSAGSICKLHDLNERNEETSFVDIISLLLEDENAEFFLLIIKELLSCIDTDSEKELIDISIGDIQSKLYKGTHLKLLLQTKMIENISSLSTKLKGRLN